MTDFIKTQSNYIAHEIESRTNQEKFNNIEGRVDKLDNKINMSISAALWCIIIFSGLHFLGFI